MSLPRHAVGGPMSFLLHHVRRQLLGHLVVLLAVLLAVGCAIGSQYGVKNLVDVLDLASSLRRASSGARWLCCSASSPAIICCGGSPAGSRAMSSSPSAALSASSSSIISPATARAISPTSFPGALAARITTAADSAWIIENSLTWTTIPPAAAVVSSIAVLGFIDWQMALVLFAIVICLAIVIGCAGAPGPASA